MRTAITALLVALHCGSAAWAESDLKQIDSSPAGLNLVDFSHLTDPMKPLVNLFATAGQNSPGLDGASDSSSGTENTGDESQTSAFKLTGIRYDRKAASRRAIINGQSLAIGQSIGDAIVEKISQFDVTVQDSDNSWVLSLLHSGVTLSK